MTSIDWRIPPSMHEHLAELPSDRPVAMLIRHSVRDELPPGPEAYTLPITAEGARLARELGALLSDRLRSVHSSPLTRTMQTARRLAEGAGQHGVEIQEDRLLGDPGAFVVDDAAAGKIWRELGHETVMAHLVADDELPGLAATDPAARFLVRHMLARADGRPGIHAFVTHDSVITATAARLLNEPLTRLDWPWYLEAAFFWQRGEEIEVRYRSRSAVRPGPLCELADRDVLGFARREIAATVGVDVPARFFLAGGAFKSLLTGRAPKDLDLWAPTHRDRLALVDRLRARGAQPLPRREYTDAWKVGERIVELARKAAPQSLEERLGRFDLAVSAVGVERCNSGTLRALVNPAARESVWRREVRVLWPLANSPHILGTIERARRAARELGYVFPSEEEDRLWQSVESTSPRERRVLLDNFERVTRGDQGVAEEVVRRQLAVGPSADRHAGDWA